MGNHRESTQNISSKFMTEQSAATRQEKIWCQIGRFDANGGFQIFPLAHLAWSRSTADVSNVSRITLWKEKRQPCDNAPPGAIFPPGGGSKIFPYLWDWVRVATEPAPGSAEGATGPPPPGPPAPQPAAQIPGWGDHFQKLPLTRHGTLWPQISHRLLS